MPYPVLDTALAALRDVTAGVPADTLDDPTPCAAWTVAQVLYHAAADEHAWAAVPATMTLLGARNWWVPSPLRRLYDRYGLREAASIHLTDVEHSTPEASPAMAGAHK